MIDRIQIKNFQCHEDLRVTFDPKITAIIGPSDIGKSACLRALKWVVTNRPLGDSFIRNGSQRTSVSIWTDSGKVTRIKDLGGENIYQVNGTKLKSFGTNVPDSVIEALRLDAFNFAGQHQMPFWFDLTSGELGKELNSIVDLSLVDVIVGNVLSVARRSKMECELVERRLKESEKELESLDYVDQMDTDLQEIEKCDLELREEEKEFTELQTLLSDYKECYLVMKQEIPDISEIETLQGEIDVLEKEANSLALLINEFNRQKDMIDSYVKNLRAEKEKFREEMGEVCPLCGAKIDGL